MNDAPRSTDAAFPATLRAAIRHLAAAFTQAGLDSPEADARILVFHASQTTLNDLVSHPETALTEQARTALAAYQKRRLTGEPVARILGEKEFWGLPFRLDTGTLVPRPDSETLIEAALALFPHGAHRILDLGTGTGCLLLALLHEWPTATGVGVDSAANAVHAAQQNARALELSSRATVIPSDWDSEVEGQFDLVISNPPYIPTADIADLDAEVRLFDPFAALDGGKDGLDDYRTIVQIARKRLLSGGFLILELGIGQEEDVTWLAQNAGLLCAAPARKDLGGIARALVAQQP